MAQDSEALLGKDIPPDATDGQVLLQRCEDASTQAKQALDKAGYTAPSRLKRKIVINH